jgi:hypothetical protein
MVKFRGPGPDRIIKKAAPPPRDPCIDVLIELLDTHVQLSIAYIEALEHFDIRRKKGKLPPLPPNYSL